RLVHVHYDDNDLGQIGYTDPDGSIHSSSGFTVPQSSVGDHTVLVVDDFNNQATRTYTLSSVPVAPTVTSASAATFTVGSAAAFPVTTEGRPTVTTTSETGMLPAGVTFTNNKDGTATLSGTPGSGTAGRYPITITASNGVSPDATQCFTLVVIGCLPPPSGLVSWWPGDGNADDIIGGNNGILQGGATFAAGIVGHAFSFDGVDDFVGLPDDLIHSRTVFTVEAWFNTTQGGVLFGYQNVPPFGFPSNYVPIVYVGSDGRLYGQVWDGAVHPITSFSAVNNGLWHHVALVAQGAGQRLYLDGG